LIESNNGRNLIMPVSCGEYRDAQQLLALKKRLAEEKLELKDQKELEKLIEELEKKLGL
jgi:hypothetical protein